MGHVAAAVGKTRKLARSTGKCLKMYRVDPELLLTRAELYKVSSQISLL